MYDHKTIQRFSEKAHEIWQESEGFRPIIIGRDDRSINYAVSHCRQIVDHLLELEKKSHDFQGKAWSLSLIKELLSVSEEERDQIIQRQYIITKDIKIEGLNVKIDKLAEILEIPSFESLLEGLNSIENQIENFHGMFQHLGQVSAPRITIDTFVAKSGYSIPESLIERITEVFTTQTSSLEENKLYVAGRKIIEALADLEDIGITSPNSMPKDKFLGNLLRNVIDLKGNEVLLSESILQRMRVRGRR